MGNVRSAAAINLKDPVSLSQAVAMAGGLVGGADAERIKLRRQVPNSINREELIVNLKAINQGKADDILLVPNDIIDVPGPSGSRKILQTILRTIIPTVTQLPMTVIRY
jgi:polysaccharide export outer membrane protein